ncbi:WavE lipopolysaccharide synthesis family protein [Aeromonas rivipollensis]|uniref:WavE lipopolysaccharide synthesis family protein n=1 Tax=Aeromonas rivipollensis TaxID=948519 RepID=UPI003D1FD18F
MGVMMPVRIINKIFNFINRYWDAKFTFHSRSFKHESYNFCQIVDGFSEESKVGIVVQGPIHTNPDVTLNTLLLYKRMFPKSYIILSTWNDADQKLVSNIRSSGIDVLLNNKPPIDGAHNVNLQILSTLNGIKAASENGCKYVLKTRTDMRFTRYTSLSALLGLLATFTSNNLSSSMGRIIEVGSTACRFRPWSLCDLFQFGHINDMVDFWSLEFDSRDCRASDFFSIQRTPREVSEHNVAEIYLHRKYAEKLGYKTGFNPLDYYEFIKNEILIIDKEMLDLAWFKYDSTEYSWVGDPVYGSNQALSRIHFFEWMLIYLGQEVKIDTLELFLDKYER